MESCHGNWPRMHAAETDARWMMPMVVLISTTTAALPNQPRTNDDNDNPRKERRRRKSGWADSRCFCCSPPPSTGIFRSCRESVLLALLSLQLQLVLVIWRDLPSSLIQLLSSFSRRCCRLPFSCQHVLTFPTAAATRKPKKTTRYINLAHRTAFIVNDYSRRIAEYHFPLYSLLLKILTKVDNALN